MAMKANVYTCVRVTCDEHPEYHRIGKREFERAHRLSFARIAGELRRA